MHVRPPACPSSFAIVDLGPRVQANFRCDRQGAFARNRIAYGPFLSLFPDCSKTCVQVLWARATIGTVAAASAWGKALGLTPQALAPEDVTSAFPYQEPSESPACGGPSAAASTTRGRPTPWSSIAVVHPRLAPPRSCGRRRGPACRPLSCAHIGRLLPIARVSVDARKYVPPTSESGAV